MDTAASAVGSLERNVLPKARRFTELGVEKGKKAGVKILMSGGTRCNITHHCDIVETGKECWRPKTSA